MTEALPIYRTYEDYPIEDLLLYAGIDCIATSELLAKTFPVIAAKTPYITSVHKKTSQGFVPTMLASIEKFEMPAFEFICDLEINGLKYDIEENHRMKSQMEYEISSLEHSIASAIGRKIDLDSGAELGKFLYVDLELTPPARTKTGAPSTDGDSLQSLVKSTGIPYLADIAKRNDIASAYRTFIKTYVEDHVKRDGRIHPSYNLHGTSSFRITGDNPNLTQLPRPKHGYNIRKCFRVEDGMVFITLDFSSAEVKILGALCKDPTLLKAIREGKDFHSFSASAMRGIPYEEFIAVLEDKTHPLSKVYKEYRQAAKALTFGILYGSSTAGVAMNLGITTSEAQALIDMYFKTYPLIEKYVQDAHLMAIKNQFVITPFGQRKMEFGTLPMYRKTAVYNAALRNAQNVRVQSTSSTLGLVVFTELNKAIKPFGAKSICTVYDSIELEVPIAHAAEVLEIAFYYMDDFPVEVFKWLDLPIGVEAEVGPNWGELTQVHRGTSQAKIEQILGITK